MKNTYSKQEVLEIFSRIKAYVDPEYIYEIIPGDASQFNAMLKELNKLEKEEAKALKLRIKEWDKLKKKIEKETAERKALLDKCVVDTTKHYPPCELDRFPFPVI